MQGIYFGGVEGGATHSKLLICNGEGEIVASVTGPGTNHWMIGIVECAKRIAQMTELAKAQAKIPENTKLMAIGLSLSGCEQEATNKDLENELKSVHPNCAENFVVCSDTVGSISTASPLGGLVLISGTGSNALLRNPDGETFGCGGWGNVLGDEGSAWWIAHRAMKTVFDDEDNLARCQYSTAKAWSLIQTHFGVATRHDLLPHCYVKFDKPFFAGLCARLAEAANDGDALCLQLFADAGHLIARAVLALLPKVHSSMLKAGDLSIVCVGSVWLSWQLLQKGFVAELNASKISTNLKLMKLKQTMALGAVYLAADSVEYELPRDYSQNYEIFYHYHPKLGNGFNGTT